VVSARVHLVVTPKLAEGQTQTPIAVDSVVVKTTVTQGSVDVALSNASAYSASTVWKVYDEGFIAGLLESFAGAPFKVKEVDCWCTGDRTCRFTAEMVR